MPLVMWAKTAVGTNLAFVKGFGKAVKNWRDIIHETFQRKVAAKTKIKRFDFGHTEAQERCLERAVFQNRANTTLQSRIFRSLLSNSRTFSKSLASELRRRSALRLSSSSGRNFRNVPIMSLIGVSLGLDISTFVDDSGEKMMSEIRQKFRSYTWQIEPLEKLPQGLNDLDISLESIASGCEGAVYKAKVKADTAKSTSCFTSSVADEDGEYDLAVKAVFNYGTESNSYSILRALEREIVPLRAEGCQIDFAEWNKMKRLPPHPNIVDMPGMFIDDMLVTDEGLQKFPAAMPRRLNPDLHFGRNKTLYLVMRRRSTHLRDYLAKNRDIPMEIRCLMLAQLLEGVAHMALNGIAHRDLKSDNVLVDMAAAGGAPHLEICDFGCCLAEENKSLKVPFPTRDMYMGGNSWLMAPEIVTAVPGPNNVLDFRKSDLWAAGAMAYEILGGENPFYPSTDNSRRQLSSRSYCEEDLPPLPVDVPGPVHRLVKSLLARDPKKRPSPSVAATVAQMVVLEGKGFQNQQSLMEKTKTMPRKVTLTDRRLHGRRLTSLSVTLYKERQKFMWIMIQSLSMLCQLIFGNQSQGWDMKSVMNFQLLSRLNYLDFKDALKFF